jgi:hypothetical protein
MSNNRRGSISLFQPPVPTPRTSISEEHSEVKGIKTIKEELVKISEELNKLKSSKCKCRCSEVEHRLVKQIDNLNRSLKEIIEN